MFKKLLRLLSVLALIILIYISYQNLVFQKVIILHTNDIHGHVLPKSIKVNNSYIKKGGTAVLARAISEQKKRFSLINTTYFLVDAGDWFAGTPEGNLSKGQIMIDLFNAMGYDFLTIGNHEFDQGVQNLQNLINKASPIIVGTNIEGLNGISSLAVKEINGIRIGFFGLLTDDMETISLKENLSSVKVTPYSTAMRWLETQKKNLNLDILVGITHIGFPADKKLLELYPFIDVIIGGHSHTTLETPYFPTKAHTRAVAQAGSYCKYLGILEIRINRITKKISKISGHLIKLREISAARGTPYVKKLINKYENALSAKMDQVIGYADTPLTRDAFAESLLGDLTCDIMRTVTGADIAFQNSFGIRDDIGSGPITYRKVYQVHPFDNTIVLMQLTGAQIKEILEQSATLQKGIIQLSGLKVTYDMSRPLGQRVVKITLPNGKPINYSKYYTVATNNFLAQGGDNFSEFKKGKQQRDTYISVREAFANYIRQKGHISVKKDGRIKILNYKGPKDRKH